MNEDFYKADNYYLVDIFNGKIKKSNIAFKIIENSIYPIKHGKQVEIESKIKKLDDATGKEYYAIEKYLAFIKSSLNSYSDDLDVINSELANLFDISASKVYHLETENNLKGIINIGVKTTEEQELTIDKLVNQVINLLKNHHLDLNDWLKAYFCLPKTSENSLLENKDDIKNVIEMGLNVINLFTKSDAEDLKKLTRHYIQMIFFDLLTNNHLRNFDTYSILLNLKDRLTKLA